MVVQDEDLHLGGLGGELLLDPAVPAAPDLAVIEIRLARVDRDDRDRALAEHGVALAEHLLEVHVPDVAGVVVPGDDDERVAVDAVEVLARGQVLVPESERREVARAHDDVRLELVDLADRTLEQARLEVRLAAVEVGKLGDPEHDRSLRPPRGRPRPLVPWRRCGTKAPFSRHIVDPTLRGSPTASRSSAPRSSITTASRGTTSPIPSSSSGTTEGRVVSAFTPDFYLPEQNLFIEVTVMKQSLVTRKNRKLREVQRLYPHVRVKLFYRRDIERLAQRYRLRLAS